MANYITVECCDCGSDLSGNYAYCDGCYEKLEKQRNEFEEENIELQNEIDEKKDYIDYLEKQIKELKDDKKE